MASDILMSKCVVGVCVGGEVSVWTDDWMSADPPYFFFQKSYYSFHYCAFRMKKGTKNE